MSSFCQEKGISSPSFYSWRRKFASEVSPAHDRDKDDTPTTSVEAAFIPLSLPGILAVGDLIEIVHPHGHVLRVPNSFDEPSLTRILHVLDQGAQ